MANRRQKRKEQLFVAFPAKRSRDNQMKSAAGKFKANRWTYFFS